MSSSKNSAQYNSFEEPKKKKVPKRILHFSDGVLEEYSTDEDERAERQAREQREEQQQVVSTSDMTWLPWFVHLAWMTAAQGLAVCDSVGEKLAWWLGITSPKYYYEIQEAKRMKKEEEERLARQDAEMAGWEKRGGEGGVVSSQEIATARVGEQPQESH